jgi:RNA polymerase sigma factor (TIGR02999 family)
MDASEKSQKGFNKNTFQEVYSPKQADELMSLVYEELRKLAHNFFLNERIGHTLEPTALVHEAYLRLAENSLPSDMDKTHFLAVCAKIMRHILIDYARQKNRLKRGGGQGKKVEINSSIPMGDMDVVDIVALNEAIEKLAALDQREADVVELRIFAGLSVQAIAQVLGVSRRTIEGDWTHAKAWLKNELSGDRAA